MSTTIRVTGGNSLLAAFTKFAIDLDKAVDDAVLITANNVLVDATKTIREPSQGEKVKRGKKTHTVSKEGDSPNTDTGRLIGSITVVHAKGSQEAFVGTNLEYGAMLETTHNRPWLEPAKDRQVADFDKTLQNVVDVAIKKAGK